MMQIGPLIFQFSLQFYYFLVIWNPCDFIASECKASLTSKQNVGNANLFLIEKLWEILNNS